MPIIAASGEDPIAYYSNLAPRARGGLLKFTNVLSMAFQSTGALNPRQSARLALRDLFEAGRRTAFKVSARINPPISISGAAIEHLGHLTRYFGFFSFRIFIA
jgi:hypothetical protein